MNAPPPIRQALYSPASNTWTEALLDNCAPGRLADTGDLALPETDDAMGMIEGAASKALASSAPTL